MPLSLIFKALACESEIQMAYRIGHEAPENERLVASKPAHSGLIKRLASFCLCLIKNIRFEAEMASPQPFDVLVFSETQNQASALASTLMHLGVEGLSVSYVIHDIAVNVQFPQRDDRFTQLSLSISDTLKVAIISFLRFPKILGDLKNRDRRLREWHFDKFLRCHIWLVYFERVIRLVSPKIILLSNDHNCAQRSLVALANVKGIKTAYLQHASVIGSFPALAFDYSFLDGLAAFNTYLMCERNKPLRSCSPGSRYIFLTGHKKPIIRSSTPHPFLIGLAINALDSLCDVFDLVNLLGEAGHSVCLRWHPGLTAELIDDILRDVESNSLVTISNPKIEPISDYMSRIGLLIAANSSIHLEAALAARPSLYYEISSASVEDRYGYVKSMLCPIAKDTTRLLELIQVYKSRKIVPSVDVVQFFSATFGTEWEAREGELTARIIKCLLESSDPAKCWGYAGKIDIVSIEQVELNQLPSF